MKIIQICICRMRTNKCRSEHGCGFQWNWTVQYFILFCMHGDGTV